MVNYILRNGQYIKYANETDLSEPLSNNYGILVGVTVFLRAIVKPS